MYTKVDTQALTFWSTNGFQIDPIQYHYWYLLYDLIPEWYFDRYQKYVWLRHLVALADSLHLRMAGQFPPIFVHFENEN